MLCVLANPWFKALAVSDIPMELLNKCTLPTDILRLIISSSLPVIANLSFAFVLFCPPSKPEYF